MKIEIHVHHHYQDPYSSGLLRTVRESITASTKEITMAISTAEQALLQRFDAATSALAAKIQELIDNPPDDAEFDTRLAAIADGLEAMGKTVPPPVTPA